MGIEGKIYLRQSSVETQEVSEVLFKLIYMKALFSPGYQKVNTDAALKLLAFLDPFQHSHFSRGHAQLRADFSSSISCLKKLEENAPAIDIHAHWEPFSDINFEVNWKFEINWKSKDLNKHTALICSKYFPS